MISAQRSVGQCSTGLVGSSAQGCDRNSEVSVGRAARAPQTGGIPMPGRASMLQHRTNSLAADGSAPKPYRGSDARMRCGVRTADLRVAAAVTGGGLYVVGGWLLLSRLFSGGIGPLDQPAPDASPPPSCICAQAAARSDPDATLLKVLTISVVDGPTYKCSVGAHLVSADSVLITHDEYHELWRGLDCV
jgi:hypothetical protein